MPDLRVSVVVVRQKEPVKGMLRTPLTSSPSRDARPAILPRNAARTLRTRDWSSISTQSTQSAHPIPQLPNRKKKKTYHPNPRSSRSPNYIPMLHLSFLPINLGTRHEKHPFHALKRRYHTSFIIVVYNAECDAGVGGLEADGGGGMGGGCAEGGFEV